VIQPRSRYFWLRMAGAEAAYDVTAHPGRPRMPGSGLDLVEPGPVQVHQWRPDPGDFAPERVVSAHDGVARKASA
jgi:hypothetical protein